MSNNDTITPQYLTVSDVARRLGIAPRKVSDAFYLRRLDDVTCPIVGGRRMIPAGYVPTIEALLTSHDP